MAVHHVLGDHSAYQIPATGAWEARQLAGSVLPPRSTRRNSSAELGSSAVFQWPDLDSNQPTGSLPLSLEAQQLQRLDSYSNQPMGSLPPELWEAQHLHWRLSQFIESLPPSFGSSAICSGSAYTPGRSSDPCCRSLKARQFAGSVLVLQQAYRISAAGAWEARQLAVALGRLCIYLIYYLFLLISFIFVRSSPGRALSIFWVLGITLC